MRRPLLAGLVVLGVLAGCGGSDEPSGPSATVEAAEADPTTTTTTEALTPEEEVEAAYLKSWEVYAEAMRELDAEGAEEVYANDALVTLLDEVERHRRERTTVLVEVEHNYEISILEPARAIVLDQYVNHSRLADADGKAIEADPNESLTELYTLLKIEGRWKVTGFQRQ